MKKSLSILMVLLLVGVVANAYPIGLHYSGDAANVYWKALQSIGYVFMKGITSFWMYPTV